jgi:hypothetical protein
VQRGDADYIVVGRATIGLGHSSEIVEGKLNLLGEIWFGNDNRLLRVCQVPDGSY